MIRRYTKDEKDERNIKSATTSSSKHKIWSGSVKDPRIVRVSSSGGLMGGKDRHSKVRTIRGLRDRRVRLSVPTAIQLYDLQDRLGLNQPSKVVDWLLNAAQHQINKLPPLNFPAATVAAVDNFFHFHPQSLDQKGMNFEGEEEYPKLDVYDQKDVGIYNNDHNVLLEQEEQDLGLIGNEGFANYASNYYYHWPDQSAISNRSNYFAQLGDVAHASFFSSYMTSTSTTTNSTVSCELDGVSIQQNLPLNNSSAIFRNSFHQDSPKSTPF